MKIDLHEVPVRDVVAGYVDSAENGVVGYGGKLNIRPAFQREFIYKDKQRDEVIRTITKQFPLNVMYWVKGDNGNFELLDGQERHLNIRAFSPEQTACRCSDRAAHRQNRLRRFSTRQALCRRSKCGCRRVIRRLLCGFVRKNLPDENNPAGLIYGEGGI